MSDPRDEILGLHSGNTPEQLLDGIVEVVTRAGIPLWRASTALHVLHPEILGTHITWLRGGAASSIRREHGMLATTLWQGSPIEQVVAKGKAEVRCRLDVERDMIPYRELVELASKGATDYCAFGLDTSHAVDADMEENYWRRHWISFTSDAKGGFTDAQLELLRSLRFAFETRIALEAMRFSTNALLQAYLGANAAKRILTGGWRRGTGDTLRAVVWFCDMRGFTTFSDTRPPREVVATLDAYFDAVASPVDNHGGEVLKFIGDAALGVFPVGASGAEPACAAAIAAAREACANLAALNATRAAKAEPPLGLGIAMHVGDVMYGNIGAQNRLDFTVIGAPVNEVCRVEPLTRTLGVDVLLTSAFVREARLATAPSLGKHALKGVSEPLEVFGLP